MLNRTAVLSAIAMGCLAGISLTTVSSRAADSVDSADQCLSAPKSTTPPGGHWYYRIEKGTKRKCWYLGDEGAKVNKTPEAKSAATETKSPAANTQASAPAESKPIRKSVANARAEMTEANSGEDPKLAESTWPPLAQSSSDAVVGEGDHGAAAQPAQSEGANQPNWNMASRWPAPNGAPAADNASTTQTQNTQQPAPALSAERLAQAAAPTATPAQTSQAIPPQQAAPESFPIRLLLAMLVGILALAAILGPVIFKYIRPRPRIQLERQRRSIWDVETPEVNMTPREVPSPALHRVDFDEVQHAPGDQEREIEELLARMSRRPAQRRNEWPGALRS